jgi:hypothetical protein
VPRELAFFFALLPFLFWPLVGALLALEVKGQEMAGTMGAGVSDQPLNLAALGEKVWGSPGEKLSPEARDFLGRCLYAAGDYAGAFWEFSQGYRDYPLSDRAAGFLLKMTYCQSLLGNGPGAMETLRVILAKFPDSDSAGLVNVGRGRFIGL